MTTADPTMRSRNDCRHIVHSFAVWIGFSMLWSALYGAPRRLPPLDDVYRAQPFAEPIEYLSLAAARRVDLAVRGPARGGFSHFPETIRNVEVTDEGLAFTVTSKNAVLGWGRHGGLGSESASAMWHGLNLIRMRVKQSAAQARWTATLWSDGLKAPGYRGLRTHNVHPLEVKGGQWRELEFPVTISNPDGFQVAIDGPPGNSVTIGSLAIVRPVTKGVFRKTFTIPKGARVWRARAGFGPAMTVYVNGNRLALKERNAQVCMIQSADLAPHLKEGANCLAFEVDYVSSGTRREQTVLLYCQGSVVLESGERILLDGDPTWKWSPQSAVGWIRPEFDDRAWAYAEMRDTFPHAAQYLLCRGNFYPLIAYDGLIAYRHPSGERLNYDSAAPTVLEVCVPRGLAPRRPRLSWVLCEVDPFAFEEREVARAETERYAEKGNSLVYALDFGRLEQKVYTIKTVITDATGAIIEDRYREPLAVYGKIPMEEVAGTRFEEGMKLELESTIDFTDPNDPHEMVEKEGEGPVKYRGVPKKPLTNDPLIVRTAEGLVYRETRSTVITSLFGAKFAFRHPGDWYVGVLEYPDDKIRKMGISVNNTAHGLSQIPTDSGPALETGGMNPLTKRMRELKWILRADTGEASVYVLTLREGATAAARSLKFYHVTDRYLPAVRRYQSGERLFGAHLERAVNAGINFGISNPGWYEHTYFRNGVDLLGCHIYRLAWCHDVANHVTQYLRFTGQNLYIMGAYQYNEDCNPYVLPHLSGSSRVASDIRGATLRYLESNGISMLSLIEFVRDNGLLTGHSASDSAMHAGADTAMPVLDNGRQYGCLMNFIHPRVEAAYLKVVDDLALKFGDSPAWKGIYLMPFPHQFGIGPAFCPRLGDPLSVGYGDVTVRAFEAETGVRIPAGAGPDRFRARHAFLTGTEMREKWIDWRCRRQRDVAVKIRDVLHGYRDDLMCVMTNYTSDTRLNTWLRDDALSYREMNRLYGFDAGLFAGLDGIWYGRYMLFAGGTGDSPVRRIHRINAEAATDYARGQARTVGIMDAWKEVYVPMPKESGWPRGPIRTLPKPAGDYWKEAFMQAFVQHDARLITFGFADVGQQVGQEQKVREIARVVTALPAAELPLVKGTGMDENIAVRAGPVDGRYWVVAANPGCWSVRGKITLKGVRTVQRAWDGAQVKTVRGKGGTRFLPFELSPYGMEAYVAGPGTAKAVSAAPEVFGETGVDSMRRTTDEWMSELVANVQKHADLLTETIAERDVLAARTREIRALIERGGQVRALHRLYAPDFYPYTVLLTKLVRVQAGPFDHGTVAYPKCTLLWNGEVLLTGQQLVVTCQAADDKGIRYYASAQAGEWGPFRQPAWGDGQIRWGTSLRYGTFLFREDVSVLETGMDWVLQCTLPFAALQRYTPEYDKTWPWLERIFLSRSDVLWGCPVSMTMMNGEVATADVPSADPTKPWSRSFRGVREATFTVLDHRFVFTAVPEGDAAVGYGGMDLLAKTGDGWVFRVPYTPPGDTWPAGTTVRFRISLRVLPAAEP